MVENKMITHSEIAAHWLEKLSALTTHVSLADAHSNCWRCTESYGLQPSLIIPLDYGGQESVSNLILLCHACRLEQPQLDDSELVWLWLSSYHFPKAKRFWFGQAMEEYEKLYKKSVLEELWSLGIRDGDQLEHIIEDFRFQLQLRYKKPILPNKATLAGLLHQHIQEMAKGNLAKAS